MAIYYGDENGKAQEVIVVGKPGPAGPQGPAGPPASFQVVQTTSSWSAQNTPGGVQYWQQVVAIPDLAAQAQVDIALDADGLNRLLDDGVTALWAENDSGTCTVKALGAAPTATLTLYLTITEVTVA